MFRMNSEKILHEFRKKSERIPKEFSFLYISEKKYCFTNSWNRLGSHNIFKIASNQTISHQYQNAVHTNLCWWSKLIQVCFLMNHEFEFSYSFTHTPLSFITHSYFLLMLLESLKRRHFSSD